MKDGVENMTQKKSTGALAGTPHNNALNTVRSAHWTRKSCAFARLLA